MDTTEECDIFTESSPEEQIYVSNENRISRNRLTKYELVRIIGERTKQLTKGAKPLVKNIKDLSYEEIVLEEIKHKMIPFKIKRKVNNKYEIWKIDELKIDHLHNIIYNDHE